MPRPVLYSWIRRSSKMVNIPRALFDGRTGRQPLYHVAIGDSPEWAYRDETLRPLQGYPGVMWTGPKVPASRSYVLRENAY
jgi:hypothetical protein